MGVDQGDEVFVPFDELVAEWARRGVLYWGADGRNTIAIVAANDVLGDDAAVIKTYPTS